MLGSLGSAKPAVNINKPCLPSSLIHRMVAIAKNLSMGLETRLGYSIWDWCLLLGMPSMHCKQTIQFNTIF